MGFLIVYAIYVIVVVSANAYYEKEHPPVFDAVGRKKGKKSYYLKVLFFFLVGLTGCIRTRLGILASFCVETATI